MIPVSSLRILKKTFAQELRFNEINFLVIEMFFNVHQKCSSVKLFFVLLGTQRLLVQSGVTALLHSET